jgi:predicted CXXCH cytochrome family protein
VLTACIIGLPARVRAQTDNVSVTKHDLSVLSGGNAPTIGDNLADYGEVCVYCHTPHTGSISAPLWNRSFSSATYNLYDANHSSTIDMNVDAQPSGTSLACLSCHDGTIGLDVVVNAPNAYGRTVPGSTPGTNTMPASSNALLDTDLRNDHPISVSYDPAQDPAFNAVAAVRAAGVKLFVDPTSFGEKVQCASCHKPHNNANAPLLRVNNSGSSLYLTCHIK